MKKIELVPLSKTSIQLIDGDRGANYPSKTDFTPKGHCLFLDSSNLSSSGFDFSKRQFISHEKDSSMKKGKAQRGDLIMNTRGTVGNIAHYTDDVPYADIRINSGMLLIRGGNEYSNEFLFSYFRSSLFINQVNNMMSGSVQNQLPIWIFNNVKFPVIELKTQHMISSVMSLFDRKIDINRLIITEYKKYLRHLYDYWFVQYEFPNENGRPYRSNGGKLETGVKSSLEVPVGWQVAPIGTVCDIYQPETISGKVFANGGEFRVYGSNGVIGKYSKYNHEESEIVVSCRGDCGNVIRTFPKSWVTGNAMVFKPKSKTLDKEYIYQALLNLSLKNIVTGSVQGQITRTNVEKLSVVVPKEKLLNHFSKISSPIINHILLLEQENELLQDDRERFLPLLINGQLTLKSE
jgi:type I restriction enzyme S subunit